VKALDTTVLLAILEGDKASRALLRRLRGIEIATTEANMLELAFLAVRAPKPRRGARLVDLERMRRKLTVIPIDPAAVREGSKALAAHSTATPPISTWAMLGALEAAGCDELITSDPGRIQGKWRFKLTRFGK